jgi:LCP family protein required for cell wall assembly
MWKRFLLAGAIVCVLSGVATATAGLLQVADIAAEISQHGHKQALRVPELTAAEAGAPQTILVLGSDSDDPGARSNTDTMMLVRLDPGKSATTLMSVPRDLKVFIPGYGTSKINAAYPFGGPRLAVRTVEATLPGIRINHLIIVKYQGFKAAVNRVGCVYADIDRRYFNESAAYVPIDIQPGYQKLCGRKALGYIRYRHTDTDIVRAARQQDFIRQAKDQVGVQQVISDRVEFANLFGQYADTDIRGTQEVLSLFKLIAFSAGRPVREVHFRTQLGPSFVTSTASQLAANVSDFLYGNASPQTSQAAQPAPRAAGGTHRPAGPSPAALGLFADKTDGENLAIEASPHVPFPVLFPRYLAAGTAYADVPQRTYVIRDLNDALHQAYRLVIYTGRIGDYYGVQGTNWQDPPILARPDETRVVNGRKLDLFYVGGRLRLVALRTPSAVYWVANTLELSLSNKRMLAIAGSLQRIGQ